MRNFRNFSTVLLGLCIGIGSSGDATAQTKTPISSPTASRTAAEQEYEQALRLLKQNRPDQALKHFQRAAKLAPHNAEVQNALAQLLLRENDVDDAIVHFRTVTQLRPQLALAHAFLGQALATKGSLE